MNQITLTMSFDSLESLKQFFAEPANAAATSVVEPVAIEKIERKAKTKKNDVTPQSDLEVPPAAPSVQEEAAPEVSLDDLLADEPAKDEQVTFKTVIEKLNAVAKVNKAQVITIFKKLSVGKASELKEGQYREAVAQADEFLATVKK